MEVKNKRRREGERRERGYYEGKGIARENGEEKRREQRKENRDDEKKRKAERKGRNVNSR